MSVNSVDIVLVSRYMIAENGLQEEDTTVAIISFEEQEGKERIRILKTLRNPPKEYIRRAVAFLRKEAERDDNLSDYAVDWGNVVLVFGKPRRKGDYSVADVVYSLTDVFEETREIKKRITLPLLGI